MKRRIKMLMGNVYLNYLYTERKKSKLRIIFDAKGMRKSSRFWHLKRLFNLLNKNQNKRLLPKRVYTTPLKMALKNCHLDKASKHNILSAATHTCTPFIPTKPRRRPENHINLISVS